MKDFIILKRIPKGSSMIHCFELGYPVSDDPENCWIGFNRAGHVGYTFFKRGRFFGDFEIPCPPPVQEIVMGNSKNGDRWRFRIEDYDDEFFLIRKVK